MKKLKELMRSLTIKAMDADCADAAWEADPENPELEAEFDRAYKAEYRCREKLAQAIASLAPEIDYKTAFKMTYNPKLADLISRMA